MACPRFQLLLSAFAAVLTRNFVCTFSFLCTKYWCCLEDAINVTQVHAYVGLKPGVNGEQCFIFSFFHDYAQHVFMLSEAVYIGMGKHGKCTVFTRL